MQNLVTLIYVLEQEMKLANRNEKELLFRSQLKEHEKKKSLKEKKVYLLKLLKAKKETPVYDD